MKYIEFKKYTDENGAQPIYLFEGEEVYFREKGEALLKSRYLQERGQNQSVGRCGQLLPVCQRKARCAR